MQMCSFPSTKLELLWQGTDTGAGQEPGSPLPHPQKHNQTRNSHNSPPRDQKDTRKDSSWCCLAPPPRCQPHTYDGRSTVQTFSKVPQVPVLTVMPPISPEALCLTKAKCLQALPLNQGTSSPFPMWFRLLGVIIEPHGPDSELREFINLTI